LRPLHICFICSEYPPAPHGGIGSFTQVLGRELVKRGHRVTALGSYPDQHAGTENDQGVNVIRLSRRGLPWLRVATNRAKFARAFRDLHEAHPVDIVEGGELEMSVFSRSAPGVKLLRMHGGPTFYETGSRIQKWKERWSFHIADELCAVSHCVAEGTRRMLGLGERHIEVIHNPIETNLFRPPEQLAEQEGLLVFVGTISERKGIRQLIQAMPRIVAEVPQARLEVYGGEVTNPAPPVSLRAELTGLMTPEVAAHVEWKGRVARSELPQALQRASICVYPSHFEAMPIAWLEGLASGKAVVASKTGPGPEIIDDGVTGLLCDPVHPDSIARAVIRLLKDQDLRRRLGAAARHMVQDRYELESITSRNEAYYRRLTKTAS
jgi:glycosyltransferase involved in cell wall biosynthesis